MKKILERGYTCILFVFFTLFLLLIRQQADNQPILFSISLIFAGTVINLYLTNTTEMYAEFQQENGNFVITLSENYSYFETDKTTAFFAHNLSSAKRQFKLNDNTSMRTYESMLIDIKISELVAVPIITLSGILNGDDIGNIADILFILLLGFIIEKYDK